MTLTRLCRRAFLGIVGTALAALGLVLAACSHHLYVLLRRALGLAALTLAAVGLAGGVAAADELGARAPFAAPGIRIHDADETLRDYCRTDAEGRLWFTPTANLRFELVLSTADPSIVNKGDGSFHPYDAAEVRAALAGVRYPLGGIAADVFLLPFPRAGALESAAGPGLILLSPGVWPLPTERQHAEAAHELGHVVQYARMPDADLARWDAYRALRGIEDATVFSAAAPHAFRPHEIFAEDFRALFGDALATYAGGIENGAIAPPGQVAGLAAFLVALADRPVPAALVAAANPSRGGAAFTRAGASAATLELFDLAGRRIAAVAPAAAPGGTVWRWDGHDAGGRACTGTLFARLRGEPGAAARITVLP